MLEESKISPGDVEEITAFIGPYAYGVVGRPFEPGRSPQASAQFNLQYAIASLMVRGPLMLEHYEDGAVLHDGVLGFLRRVHVVEDPSIDTEFRSRLSISLRGGSRVEVECGPPRGHPENPMSRDEVIEKFMRNARRSSRPLDDGTAKEVVGRVLRMESMGDVKELVELLA
jgi:2-methylcitrate dehydratase